MSKHSITLKRDQVTGFFSSQSVGTDALNALLSIPGVQNPEIVNESNEQVELTYFWVSEENFWETNEHLAKFGLTRKQ